MHFVTSSAGVRLSYETVGSGPPLVLVHGSFDDHRTNWARVTPMLAGRFTIHAAARRGRGDTEATQGHRVEDEAADIVALIEAIGEPVFLLGHSYGAQVALAAARQRPGRIRKLVLYEPPRPDTVDPETLAGLEALARRGDWDGFATTFFHDGLSVPLQALDELRATDAWSAIIGDSPATLGDIRAMCRYDFDAGHFSDLRLPVLLHFGSESPREAFVTDALAAVLPDVRVEELQGQGHEAMQTAPALYAESVARFLLD